MRLHTLIFTFLVPLALAASSGCTKTADKYGNFANAESVELVQDAINALVVNYPPAKTRLGLVQEVGDPFGVSLVETMRSSGYAVAEYSGPFRGDKYLPAVPKPDGLPFAYLLDHPGKGDELRLSLHIGDESLSRMYLVQQSGGELRYVPHGLWTRRQ